MRTIKKFKLLFTIIMLFVLSSSCKKESMENTELSNHAKQTVDQEEPGSTEEQFANTQTVTNLPTIATNVISTQLQGCWWDGLTGATQAGGGAATATLSKNGLCNSNLQCFRSAELQVTGFGFNIPANATIDNIKVKINCKALVGNSIKDLSVQLANWDNVVGTPVNRAKNTFWSTAYSIRTYGGSTSSWGIQSYPVYLGEPINAPNFGLRISCKNLNTNSSAIASIDYVKITIQYTVGTSRQSQSSVVTVHE